MSIKISDEQRKKSGTILYCIAWGVEFVAASIGLLIAFFIILMSRQQIQQSGAEGTAATNMMSAFLGALPFIVVAMVELTKIPLATAFYLTTRPIWKIFIGLGLALLMLITFETMLNGFERNFTQRTYVVKKFKQELLKTEAELTEVRRQITEESAVTHDTIRSSFDAEIAQINDNRTEELAQVDAQVVEAKQTYSGRNAQVLEEQKTSLEQDIVRMREEFRAERDRIDQEYAAKTSVTTDTVSQQRAQIEAQITGLQNDINARNEQMRVELDKIGDTDASDADLTERRQKIIDDFDARIENARKDLEGERARLQSELSKAQDRLAGLQKELVATQESAHIFDNKKEQIDTLTNQIATEKANINENEGLLRSVSSRADINRLNAQKDKALAEADQAFNQRANAGSRERDAVRQRYGAQIRPLAAQLTALRQQLTNLSPKSVIEAASGERDAAIEELTQTYDARIAELEKRRDEVVEKLNEAYQTTEGKLQPALERLNNMRSAMVNKYNTLQDAAQVRFNENLIQLKDREARIDDLSKKLKNLADERVELRAEIAHVAEDSQIYRIAALWYGKDSPADITNEELRLISILWFGSLAAITAWTGTLLAFASLVVRYGGQDDTKRPSLYRALIRLMKNLIGAVVDIRRRIRAPKIIEKIIDREVPKEVIREVPVEKVVTQEVAREVITRELVYVPVFSDDPELLQSAIHQSGGMDQGKKTSGQSAAESDAKQ